ncbi:MAG: hypothetical protein IJ799_04845, partial [Bacteroidales bacterium]|nr:hypothetical protein [Bacteroidales bacterium]
MRSKLILALFLFLGLLFPMLSKQGGRAAAPSASGRATCASRIPVRANARPEAEGTGMGSFLPQDTTAAARDTARRRAPARTSSSSLPELTMPQVIPPSPAAMELAKYTAYPVDLSNGLVQISIPLYEIVDGDIRIPLALSYHASGIKPNARSCDWLGDGWSITGLPSLSRSINGGPDEHVYDARIAALDNPTWEQLEYITSQTLDVALDEFYYSAGGHSGRLYFNQIPSGTTATTVHPVVIPKDPVKVTLPTANDFSQRIDITDPQGIAYHFGGASDNYYDKTYVS